jgi:hypothetical protein
MVELDFNPKIGEYVEVFPHEGRFEGLFEIIDRHAGSSGILLNLRRVKDGRLLKDVGTYLVDYPQEERVRRALQRVLADAVAWPDDFQRNEFDIKAEEMYDGTPRIMVYFRLKPGTQPSLEKARLWDEFYSKLEKKLEPFTDSKWDWVQFTAKEERSVVSAAT